MGKGYILHRVMTAKRQRQNMIQRRAHRIRPRNVAVYRLRADIARPPITLIHIQRANIVGGELQLQRPALLVVRLASLIPFRVSFSAVCTGLPPPMHTAKAFGSNAAVTLFLRAAKRVVLIQMPVITPL